MKIFLATILSWLTLSCAVMAQCNGPMCPSAYPPQPAGSISALETATGFFNLNAGSLPHWRGAVARVRAGSGRGRVLLVGDSTTQGYGAPGSGTVVGAWPISYPSRLAALLNTNYVATSVANFFGDTNVGGVGTTYPNYDTRVTFGANWASDNSGAHTTIGAFWFLYTTGAANNIAFTPTGNIDTVIPMWWKASSGTFTFNVDGGASLGTSTNGANTWGSLTGSVAKAAHTINIVPNNNGNIFFGGIIAYDSTTPSIDIMQEGWNGATIASYLGTGQLYNAVPTFPALAPDLTVICLTINDITTNGQSGLPTYLINMQTLITAAAASGDVMLVMGVPGPTNTNADLAAYRNALLQLAVTNNIPVVDLWQRWTSYAFTNAIMPYASGVHPSKVGYSDIAQAIYDALTRY